MRFFSFFLFVVFCYNLTPHLNLYDLFPFSRGWNFSCFLAVDGELFHHVALFGDEEQPASVRAGCLPNYRLRPASHFLPPVVAHDVPHLQTFNCSKLMIYDVRHSFSNNILYC